MKTHKNPKIRAGKPDQMALVLWASSCAGHVLRYFEAVRPEDRRPGKAIEAARAWARDGIGTGLARSAALASHAAARSVADPAARAAARAAGHAAATAHMSAHARHAAAYAASAVAFASSPAAAAKERKWQFMRLPGRLKRGPLKKSSFFSFPRQGGQPRA